MVIFLIKASYYFAFFCKEKSVREIYFEFFFVYKNDTETLAIIFYERINSSVCKS